MKIGIDARFFGPGSKGLGRYTQKLIENLERIDHKNQYVVFLTRENYDQYIPKNPLFSKALADYRWYTLSEQVFFPWLLYRHKCNFVHFPHFNVPVFYRRRFMVTIHDLILVRYPTRKSSTHSFLLYWFKYWMYRIVIWNAIHGAHCIAAVSQFTKEDILLQYSVDPEKITVTLEAAMDRVQQDLSPSIEVSADDRELAKTLDERANNDIWRSIMGRYLLYVGNAYPHKNLYKLVQAFHVFCTQHSQENEFSLVLVGKNDYFYSALRKYIKKEGIKNVVILDTVTHFELGQLYRRAHIFVFPSLYEGFGLPPLEACSYGLPVISSRLSCMPEILGDAVHYCDVEDIHSIAHAMCIVSDDEVLRKELSEKGPRQAAKYSWISTAEMTYALYETFEEH